MIRNQMNSPLVIGTVTLLCITFALGQGQQPNNEELNTQAYIELMRSDLRANKRYVITKVMQFSEKDAALFWPIYEEYEKELSVIGDARVKLINDYVQNYDGLSDSVAENLIGRSFDLETKRTDLKRKYFDKFKKALPAATVARFFQVDNQISLLIDLQLAATLPVASKLDR